MPRGMGHRGPSFPTNPLSHRQNLLAHGGAGSSLNELIASLPKTGDETPKNVYEPPEIGCRVGGLPRPIRHLPHPKQSSTSRKGRPFCYAECAYHRWCWLCRLSHYDEAAF